MCELKKIVITLLLLLSLPFTMRAEKSDSDVNIKEIVLGHIMDSYEWHITTVGEKHITIPLPIIVHSKTTGWHTFFSSKFHHSDSYQGFSIAKEGKYEGKIIETAPDGTQIRPLDISLTKTALGIIINSIVVILLIMVTSRWYRRHEILKEAPKGFVGVMEMLINSILEGVIIPCVGSNYAKFAPYLLTAFFFIFVNNIMGLIPFFPGGANVTGNIAVTLVLAVATFFVVNIFGTKSYWKDVFWPDVPIFLKAPLPIMPLIEFVGLFTKPFALMIRLFANIMAGHSVLLILTCIVFATAKMGVGINASMSAVSVLFSIFMDLLELLVAFIQAYVFTMLSAVFIGLAQHNDNEKHNKTIITNN